MGPNLTMVSKEEWQISLNAHDATLVQEQFRAL